MNKDVIYIEPEDDITDIITKIESSKEKIIALVPPKKAGVLRSVVNIKLINKAATSAKKTVVIVTTDPSITKLAAAARLPITKDLQSAPTIPKIGETDNDKQTTEQNEDVVDENENGDDDETNDDKEGPEDDADNNNEDDDKDSDEPKKEKTDKKAKKNKLANNKFFNWLGEHKKISIASCFGVVLLILLLVWMFKIAPAATVTVEIKTDVNNFSETVSFTTKLEDENADEGKFYLEERKLENVEKVEFEATGKKNIGEKAKGVVVVYASINYKGGVVVVNSGDTFTNNGLSFIADAGVRMSFDGDDTSVCANEDVSLKEFKEQGCRVYARVNVTASEPGAAYNLAATDKGWSTSAPVAVYSDSAMAGGTDENITVVSQADIDKAKETIASSDENENKQKLISDMPDNLMVIDSSFTQETGDSVSVPAVGEKVEADVKPTLTIATTARIYAIDKTKIEEFIREKAKLEESQKIYEIKSPFIENFMKTDNGYTGKLKTSYAVGPRVTENDIIEVIKGKGLGEAQHDLKDIDGITTVKIDKSYPWVTSIPGDVNKITVILEIKE